MPFDIAAPMGCGIQTGAVLNTLKPQTNEPIAIFGCGAVGMSAIMAAKVAGCHQIIAVGGNPSSLALAKELGNETIAQALSRVSHGGVDHAFDTSGNGNMILNAIESTCLHGKVVLLAPTGTLKDFNIGIDVIPEDRDFSSYKVVILPQMIITKPDMEERIQSFAHHGGTVVFTYRHAVKDRDNNIPFGETLPVHYTKLTGLTVEETESLQEYKAFPLIGQGIYDGVRATGGIFRDMIQVQDAEVLFTYGDQFYKDFAAITRKQTGKGMTYYIGCGLDEMMTARLMEQIMTETDITMHPSDDGVEIVVRGQDEKIMMMINHNAYEVQYKDVTLAPFEVKITVIE